MKRLSLALVLVLLVSLSAFGFDSSELNTVTFANNTGFDIMYLFFSPGDSSWWGPDILGSDRILFDGDSISFFVHYPHSCDDFDFLAIDEDGDSYLLWDYSICDGWPAEIEVTLDDYDPDHEADLDFVNVELSSEIGYDIYYAFVSPSDSEMLGVDMLDNETILYPGETLSLVVPAGRGSTNYDVIAVDEDMDTYSFSIGVSNKRSSWAWSIEPGDMN